MTNPEIQEIVEKLNLKKTRFVHISEKLFSESVYRYETGAILKQTKHMQPNLIDT